MELYFSPGACSMASHIALNEAGIKHDMKKVDLKSHTYDNGKDFYAVNPKGYVPALKLDSGDLLTENAVVLQYIADQKPESQLMPKQGTIERYHAMEWLNFIATEVHKKFFPFFNPKATDDEKKQAKEIIPKKLELAEKAIAKNGFLMGRELSAPDCYLYVMLTWAKKNDIDLSKMPSLMTFHEKMSQRPSVQETMKMEGLN